MKFSKTKMVLGVATASLILNTAPSYAGGTIKIDNEKSISVGVGIRAAFIATEDASPNGDSYSKDFDIQSSRVYISGQLNPTWKFTFNTEEIWGEYGVLDAMIQYEPNAAFNVWMGRVLTPADRIEMNGPFYGLTWNQYTVPLYASDAIPSADAPAGTYGRDDGVVVWGSSGKFQYAVGIFDGYSGPSNGDDNVLFAGRFAYNFLNKEQNPGYYTSSTYYGGLGNIFTVGLSFQAQSDSTGTADEPEDFAGYAVDFLYEGVLDNGGVVNVEGEYKVFDTDAAAGFQLFSGDAMFLTAAYMFPAGDNKVQPYVRYTSNGPDRGDDSDLVEVGVNYILKGHNLRWNANITDGDANASGAAGTDAQSLSVGVQYQL